MAINNLLLDSSILVAFYNLQDTQYKKAGTFFTSLEKKNVRLSLHPLVFIETLSILKMKIPHNALLDIQGELMNEEKFFFLKDERISFSKTDGVWEYFNAKNNLSFVDAAIVDYCLNNGCELATFDKELEKVYSRQKRN